MLFSWELVPVPRARSVLSVKSRRRRISPESYPFLFASPPQQVALAAILVACKLNDTLKKAREVIVASFPIRFPDLVKAPPPSSNSSSTTTYHLSLAGISESDVDPQVLESERTKVLSLERTMLESIGYGFRIRQNVEHVGKGVLKLGRAWGGKHVCPLHRAFDVDFPLADSC